MPVRGATLTANTGVFTSVNGTVMLVAFTPAPVTRVFVHQNSAVRSVLIGCGETVTL